jgi:hypothetical protein
MSVRIVIGKGAVFTPTTVNQRDLVFWYNDDSQQHYPVPGCSKIAPNDASLQVAPGGTTPQFQPASLPNLPVTITYGCAISGHESESGTITVNPDSGTSSTGTPAGPTTKTIDISAAGAFATVDVAQSDTVVWKNNDSKTHFPVPNCTGLQVQPQGVTNGMQPAAPWALPMAITYGCAMPGHQSESGTINVYNDFVAATPPVDLSTTNNAPIATGGKSPYQMTDDPTYPYLTLQETAPAGSSTGVSITVSSPPAGVTTVNYQLDVTDAMGNTINTPIQIKLS